VASLVAAATELFAARGPDGVSLREIAAHAGLNYGLIHQYVGSKDELLRLVIARSTSTTAARFAQAADVGEALELLQGPVGVDRPAYPRLLAWAILQGRDPRELAGPSPALPQLIAMLPVAGALAGGTDGGTNGGTADRDPADRDASDRAGPAVPPDLTEDPRLRAAAVAALTLGWSLFGTFVSHAAGLDDVAPAEAHAAVQSLARRIAGI
jgi:TetR/AcrR family transcriptional regulator, repressor for neighboring sulfatase